MKRVLLSAILVILTSFFFLAPIQAADDTTSWVDTGYAESMSAAQNGDVNAAAHVSNVNTNTYSDAIRRILGPIPGITISSNDMNTPYAEQMRRQSAVNGVSTYISYMYTNPPASTYAFVQDMGQSLGFIPKQAYAQGIGFSGLTSLLPVWKAFRNISYAILSIVMIIIGFMVMFRKKIDPKTVVTVQNALPKIVITLILITFSYAIVGILIDLMYVVLLLATQLIIQANPTIFDSKTTAQVLSSNFGYVSKALWGGYDSFFQLLSFLNPGLTSENVFSVIGSGILATVEGVLIGVLLSLAILFMCIRLFFMLLNAYIQIIISLLTGPIQIMMDAIPGGHGFEGWIKNLISNLLVFPITGVMLLISQLLVHTSTKTWTPPLLGMGNSGVASLIGLGVLFVIPNIVKGIQESLKAKPMVPVNAGSALGPVTGAFQVGTQTVSSFYYGKELLGGIMKKKKD